MGLLYLFVQAMELDVVEVFLKTFVLQISAPNLIVLQQSDLKLFSGGNQYPCEAMLQVLVYRAYARYICMCSRELLDMSGLKNPI